MIETTLTAIDGPSRTNFPHKIVIKIIKTPFKIYYSQDSAKSLSFQMYGMYINPTSACNRAIEVIIQLLAITLTNINITDKVCTQFFRR